MHKLEPFEQVIVRNFENEVWKADTFSHFDPDLSAAIAATGCTRGFNLVARLNTAGVLTEQRVEILRTWAEKKPEPDNIFNEWRYWFKAGVITGLNQDPLPTEINLSYWIHALDMGLIDAMVDQAFRIP